MLNSIRSLASPVLCCLLLCQSQVLASQSIATTQQACLQLRSSIKTDAWLTGIYFSPDGRLITQRGKKRLKVWDALTGQLYREYVGNEARLSIIAFSRDGSRIAAGDQRSFACVWDVATGRLVAKLDTKHHGKVHHLALSPDGKLLVTLGEGACYWANPCNTKVKVWDVGAGQLKTTLTLPDLDDVNFAALAFSPDGNTLAAVLAAKAGLWDTKTWELRTKLIGPEADDLKYEYDGFRSIRDMIFSSDGRLLATLSFDAGTVILWDAYTGARKVFLSEGARSMAFSPDATLLALGGFGKTVKIFDLNAGKVVRTLRTESDRIAAVSFSPDGRLLAGSDGRDTYVWEMASGQLRQKLPQATQATFSPDGRTLVTVCEDRLTLWNVSCR